MSQPSFQGAVQAAQRTRVAALDIGTHGSGYATSSFVQKSWSAVSMHEGWPGQPDKYPKTRSVVLYKSKIPVAWGWEAYTTLACMSREEQAEHWLCENFKLALQDSGKPDSEAARLRAKGVSPEQAMADFLKPFVGYVKQQLRDQNVPPSEINNIEWVMSVPAAWDDASKDLMRTAAYRAGIIKSREDTALSLVYEPEAAALYARKTKAPPLEPGMLVCVLDVGGGTSDITVHSVEDRHGQAVLADALWAVGDLCGGAYVDKAFRALYRERVGAAAYDRWEQEHPAGVQQVMDRWLTLKHSWEPPQDAGPSTTSATARQQMSAHSSDDEDDALNDFEMFSVYIPPSLHALMSDSDRAHLRAEQGNDSDVLLGHDDMKRLFDVSVDKILELATTHLRKVGQTCTMVILVGGFSASPYLQYRVRQKLVVEDKLAQKVVIPPFPYSAVMHGSALYGCNPELIRARRTRLSYGIKQAAPYEDGAPGRFWNEEEGCFWTDSVYAKMVDKNQEVLQDEEVTCYVTPLDHDQQEARIQLYATDNSSTKYIETVDTNTRRLAELVVSLPGTPLDEDLPTICVKLKFGRAEILVSAEEESTHQQKMAKIKYATATR